MSALRLGIALATIVAVVAPGLRTATPAGAHTDVVATTPPAGATVNDVPTHLEVELSEAAQPAGRGLELIGPDGADVALGTAFAEGRSIHAAVEGRLVPGAHEVRWRAASADGHVAEGSFRFTFTPVSAAVAPLAEPAETAPAAPAAGPSGGSDRGIGAAPLAAGLLGASGAVAAALLILRRNVRRQAEPFTDPNVSEENP